MAKLDLSNLIDSVKAGMGFQGTTPSPGVSNFVKPPQSIIPVKSGPASLQVAPVANQPQLPASQTTPPDSSIPNGQPNGFPPGFKLGPVEYHPAVGLHVKVG